VARRLVPPRMYWGEGARKAERETLEEKWIGRGVLPPQGAVERERRKPEWRLEALRQHHLKNVAGGDVFLGAQHHALEVGWRRIGARHRIKRACVDVLGGLVERPVERIHNRRQPLRGP